MRKKIIATILGIIFCFSMFTGCALIEHNDEKDSRQIVAVIDPIENTTNGIPYKSDKKVIYKSELVSALNSYGSTYVNNYGMSLKEATEQILEELIIRELIVIEAKRLRAQELIVWDQRDENDKLKAIYSSIDSKLASLRGDILTEYGESTSSESEDNSDSTTTYPVPDAETTDDNYEYYTFDSNGQIIYETNDKGERVPVYSVWEPLQARYPGLYGDESKKSLERESMNRFLSFIRESVKDDFRVTSAERKAFKKDDELINEVINNEGIEYVYRILGKTAYLEYLVGKTVEESLLITKLQNYITDGVTVSDKEIAEAYAVELLRQTEAYKDNQSAYQEAVAGGSTNMLYLRDDSYFYVKHILLPFSDDQTAALKAYQNDIENINSDYKTVRDEQFVNDIKVYTHVNGEDDKSSYKTVWEVLDEVYAAMSPLRNDPKSAERKFDEFIYKYNTDPGAFGYGKQYAVKRNDDENHSGYMEEFYDGAMKLYDEYDEGSMLPELVVTDYGVHIMYFSNKITGGTVKALNDYLTPGAYKTVRETFEDTVRTAKENSAFTAWQNETITYYRERAKKVHTYQKRYKSIYEDD